MTNRAKTIYSGVLVIQKKHFDKVVIIKLVRTLIARLNKITILCEWNEQQWSSPLDEGPLTH